ncbi:hypothetical protein HMPREF9371_1500 [Neisseria shayeganii 871]|uniref:Uncharacterized protein n=1 Tax=Neisseria shayeganii 871 TaxID=1032488 RepID=G4CIR1_9NEIS|nr:hypothetical protein HMPREF9371_1500 [Neisseria shayeganii 871]
MGVLQRSRLPEKPPAFQVAFLHRRGSICPSTHPPVSRQCRFL